MHLEYMRSGLKALPEFKHPLEVSSLRVWHCKFRSLAGIAMLSNLQTLVIATYPDASLDPVGKLSQLRYLRILHMPKISDLSPISKLKQLESLSLETTPGWYASGKFTRVDSLEPIGTLSKLRYLQLFGVVPADKSLAPLEKCKSLDRARFSKYPMQEIERFHNTTQVSDAFIPEPIMG